MSDESKITGTGNPEFDAIYKELIFLRMTSELGVPVVFRFLFAITSLLVVITVLLTIQLFR